MNRNSDYKTINKYMKHFVRHTVLFLMISTVTGCYDEFMKEETIGEGKASISATLDFKPMSAAAGPSEK